MDLINRLRKFIDSTGLSSTQFADAAGISRPTMSQILTGRNKKVSNELLAKLHARFPNLDIMWLLFGGENRSSASKIEPNNPENGSENQIPTPGNEYEDLLSSNVYRKQSNSINNNGLNDEEVLRFANDFFPQQETKSSQTPLKEIETEKSDDLHQKDDLHQQIRNNRRIVSITVFYDDHTYETLNVK